MIIHRALGKFFLQLLQKVFRYQCQFIFSKYSTSTSMHFCIRENQLSKQFWKSSLVRHPIAWSKASNISSSLLNWIHHSWFFSFWKRKKSQRLRSGEYGEFWYDSTLFPAKYPVVIQARWGRPLLSWKINPRSPVFSPLCATASKTLDKQFVTYDRALIEATDSNAIDSMKPNFMKKIATILSPRKTWSVDMLHVDHRQSLIEQHWSFQRLLQCEVVQNEMSQRRPIFHVRGHETS